MASWSIWASVVVVCAALPLVAGCGGKIEKYPPPQPGDPITGSPGGSDTGGTSAGGAGGAGGDTGTSSYPPVNMCECAHTYMFNPTCGQCINMHANNMNTCKDILLQCNIDATCQGLVNCPTYCFQKPDAEKVQCIKDCILPFPDDTAHQLYEQFMRCICNECESPCAALEPITCE